ncbi:MAG: ABC transporter ATP-binding protein [Alphaproteobacteria bacterium]|nr:ABC transporter ATP-binding protein [Alphaproteobacteria bacterium]
MAETVLEARELHVGYGPIRAVRGCSFVLGTGETVAIVGANGAGKTTIMRALSNLLPRQGGAVRVLGEDTAGVPAHALVRRGLLHIPEGRGIVGRLTVRDNLRIAHDSRATASGFTEALAAAYRRFPRLEARAGQRAGSMSGGEQQMLALAKAIVNPPRVLLIDEPSLGLAPMMVREAFDVLADFRRAGMAILLVEQNVRSALALADRAYVLRQGEIVFEDTGAALLASAERLRTHLVARPSSG